MALVNGLGKCYIIVHYLGKKVVARCESAQTTQDLVGGLHTGCLIGPELHVVLSCN
jgi:hypothetical protein